MPSKSNLQISLICFVSSFYISYVQKTKRKVNFAIKLSYKTYILVLLYLYYYYENYFF